MINRIEELIEELLLVSSGKYFLMFYLPDLGLFN